MGKPEHRAGKETCGPLSGRDECTEGANEAGQGATAGETCGSLQSTFRGKAEAQWRWRLYLPFRAPKHMMRLTHNRDIEMPKDHQS